MDKLDEVPTGVLGNHKFLSVDIGYSSDTYNPSQTTYTLTRNN